MWRHEENEATFVWQSGRPVESVLDIAFPITTRSKAAKVEPYLMPAGVEVVLNALSQRGMFVVAVAEEDAHTQKGSKEIMPEGRR